jgi:hypothetical protein
MELYQMAVEIEGLTLEQIREEYRPIAESKFTLMDTGPVYRNGGWVGDYQVGQEPLFKNLVAAPKIVISLCNIISCNNETISNLHNTLEQLKRSHDIAEKKLLKKVANKDAEPKQSSSHG